MRLSRSKILNVILFPFIIPSIIVWKCVSQDSKKKIRMDVEMYWTRTRGKSNGRSLTNMLYQLLANCKEFRNVFYCRLGVIGRILPLFLRPVDSLFINPVLCKNYDGGLYIAHGTSVQIYANKIGKNLWMHHNVTIGMIGEGRPIIGDNVYIGTGAVILGGITIETMQWLYHRKLRLSKY